MQKLLLLNDLLHLNQSDLDRVKVKFNQYNGEIEPMEVYLRNPDDVNTTWLFWRAKLPIRNFGELQRSRGQTYYLRTRILVERNFREQSIWVKCKLSLSLPIRDNIALFPHT